MLSSNMYVLSKPILILYIQKKKQEMCEALEDIILCRVMYVQSDSLDKKSGGSFDSMISGK